VVADVLAPRPRNSTTNKAKRGADAQGKGNQRPDSPASETLAGLGTTKQEIGGEGAEASAALGTSRHERSGVFHHKTAIQFLLGREVLDVQGGELGATEGAAGRGPECPKASSLL
jgi:hypothetical protein